MPTYTVLPATRRARLLRIGPGHTATVITTVSSAGAAQRIAAKLTDLVADLAAALVSDVEQLTGQTIDAYDNPGWLAGPAPCAPVPLPRHLLTVFDTTPQLPAHAPGAARLVCAVSHTVAAQPESVRRAVRDEVARLLAGYDDVPVIARAYDRKWGDAEKVFVAGAALAQLAHRQLRNLLDSADALEVLTAAADTLDDETLRPVAEAGYLRVELHPQQLRAWLTRHHPDLADEPMPFSPQPHLP